MSEAGPAAAFCLPCPVRQMPVFKPLTGRELAFVQGIWRARRSFAPETDILRADEAGGALYTLWEGWAYRYKPLPGTASDGRPRRQILDILLPGDVIGLESALTGESAHGVRALTQSQVCVHDPQAFGKVFAACPDLSRALMITAVRDARRMDRHLALLGQTSATQRLGFTMLDLHDRLAQRELVAGTGDATARLPWPLRRRHLADLLGISGTHVARSLVELRTAGLAEVIAGELVIQDRERLAALSEYTPANGMGQRALL